MPESDLQTANRVVQRLRQSGLRHRRADGDVANELAETGSVVLHEIDDAVLLLGIPHLRLSTQVCWLGVRVGWWPKSALMSQRVAVVSSRLSRDVGDHPEWLELLRTLLCRLAPESDCLITVAQTTAHRFVHRGSQLFGFDCHQAVETRMNAGQLAAAGPTENQIMLSAPVLNPSGSLQSRVPLGDRLLSCLATQVWALRVSTESATSRLLQARLKSGFEPGSTRIAVTDGIADPILVEAGALPWILTPTVVPDASSPAGAETAPDVDVPFDDYLLHWTRGPAGPWPDEPEADYLDRLILGVETSGRSALAALMRILETRRLIASGHLIRGQHQVVCFSDQRLNHLSERRVYRRHLHRWDFEPYGIAIHRGALVRLGARPVIYGDDSAYDRLDRAEQPLFQLRVAKKGVIWESEQEWRLLGDLDLSEVDPQQAFVFVRTSIEAARVAEISPFPVLVVPHTRSE